MNVRNYMLLTLAVLTGAPAAWGLVPLPGFTVYGQANDRWGWPCAEGVSVICRINGIECARTSTRYDMGPVINFMLRIPLDDGQDPRYDAKAARIGETMVITILDDYGEHPVIQSNLPSVGMPAESTRIVVTAGTDLDQDDLPDEWEEWIVMYSFYDNVRSIWDVKPEGDFDGDGVSNMSEYLAGTFPDMSDDYFYIEKLLPQKEEALGLRFLSVPGKTYRVRATSDLAQNNWEDCEFSMDPELTAQQSYVIGNGSFMTLYVPKSASYRTRCYRLVTE